MGKLRSFLKVTIFQVRDWTKGKEKNIRALLVSLNDVLWEGADNWIQPKMADLLTPSQVSQSRFLVSAVISCAARRSLKWSTEIFDDPKGEMQGLLSIFFEFIWQCLMLAGFFFLKTKWYAILFSSVILSGTQVKKCYRRACLVIHPDKQVGKENEALARAIFTELNDAWTAFENTGLSISWSRIQRPITFYANRVN